MRILHCPIDVGGHALGLAKAQRALGYDSTCLTLIPSDLGFNGDQCLAPPGVGTLKSEAARFKLLWRAMFEYDVIHFYFGHSLLSPRPYAGADRDPGQGAVSILKGLYARALLFNDLPLLKARKRTLAVTFLGSDIRRVDHADEFYEISHYHDQDVAKLHRHRDAAKRRNVEVFDRYCDAIFAVNPDLLSILPPRARFLPYSNLNPADFSCAETRLHQSVTDSSPIRIGHAPTNRSVKGTKYLLDAVAKLQASGANLELELIENVPNVEALKRIQTIDILVDQLLVGWYGGVAVEAMAMGLPVIGYIRESDLDSVPSGLREDLPILRSSPQTIEQTLRDVLAMGRDRLRDIGLKGASFVQRHHDPKWIAENVVAAYGAAREGPRTSGSSMPKRT